MVIWDVLERYLKRLDELRRFLAVAEAIDSSDFVPWHNARGEARGSAIVCAMAELESLVIASLTHANTVINESRSTIGMLRPSLRPLAAHRALTSLAALRDPEKMWREREFVTCLDSNGEVASLPVTVGQASREPQPPLDGRTLKPQHLQRICAVYGIQIDSIIRTHQTLSLKKLSDARNDIAHASMPFHALFSRAGFLPVDIRADLDSFDEIGYGLVVAFDGYLSRKQFLAAP